MKTDLKRLHVFYQNYLKDHPYGGGWPNMQVAFDVYKASTISKLIPWESLETITDVGCGAGNLLSFIRTECNYMKEYCGIEAVDFLYNSAASNFSTDTLAEFIQSDFLNMEFDSSQHTDWVFCIGTLGTMQDDKNEYDIQFIKKLRTIAKRGMTIYVNDDRYMSSKRLEQIPDLVAHDVNSLLEMCKSNFEYKDLQVVRYPESDWTSCAITILF